MRIFYFLGILLLLTEGVKGQNWQCMQPGRKVYFTNSDGYLRGIRIDSTQSIANNVIHYLFHTPRGQYQGTGGHPLVLDLAGASWLGNKVTVYDNDTALFDNAYGDPVMIIPKAALGQSWNFYKDTTGLYYTATIAAIDTLTIENSIDSVKLIRLQAMDNLGAIADDSINRFTILISKQHGFVRIFDVYNFPYHKPGAASNQFLDYYTDIVTSFAKPSAMNSLFQMVAFRNPQYEEVYNFTPGDVYQFSIDRTPAGRPEVRTDRIIAKQDFSNHIVYSVNRKEVKWITSPWPYHYEVINSTAPLNINKELFKIVDTTLMPEETGIPYTYQYGANRTTLCTSGTYYVRSTSAIIGDIVNTFEPCGTTEIFIVNRGQVFSAICLDPSGIDVQEELTYVEHNGVICGAYNSLSLPGIMADHLLSIYPNPSTDFLTIRLPQNPILEKGTKAEFFDATGRLIFLKDIDSKATSIDVSGWASGLYFIRCQHGAEYDLQKIQVNHLK